MMRRTGWLGDYALLLPAFQRLAILLRWIRAFFNRTAGGIFHRRRRIRRIFSAPRIGFVEIRVVAHFNTQDIPILVS
jgi:hypothetical protein